MKRKQAQHSLQTGAQHKQTICFAAGHSGGHIIPCLTMAQREYAESSLLFFTSAKQLDCSLIASSDRPAIHIPLSIAQKRSWHKLPLLALSLAWATIRSFAVLITHMPERIITTGSIIALPVCIAGWVLGIPIELFELNAQPGKTIIGLSYIADTVRHCFASTRMAFERNHCIQTPYPIRFTQNEKSETVIPDFTPDRCTLFVQGGSQGSQEINNIMQNLILDAPELCAKIQVIHQAGAHADTMQKIYDRADIPSHSFSFEADITPYYQAADLIICRAGAGALFESLHFKKKTLIVPLVTPTNDHQLYNARAMATEHPELFKCISDHNRLNVLHRIIRKKIETTQKTALIL